MFKNRKAGERLLNDVIPTFAQELNLQKISPFDSDELVEMVHEYGINLRYLGLILELCNLQHLRQLVFLEMLTRLLKNIIR